MLTQEASKPQGLREPAWRSRLAGIAKMLALLSRDKAALVSLLFLITLALAALAAPIVFGSRSTKVNMADRFLPPSLTGEHIFGTDGLGRDLLGRTLLATRVSLGTAIVVVAVSLAVGLPLGVVAGYRGGRFDEIIMRLTDTAMGFPSLLLALVVIYALGASSTNLIFVLAATRWMLYTRVARAETLKLRRLQYVNAAESIGCTDGWIVRRHIMPNLLGVLFVIATLELGVVVLAESGLSFLGLGVQPPAASLGLLIAQGKEYINRAWWLMFVPGVTIFLTAMAFNLLANWLGLAVDPIQRWRLTSKK